MSVTNSTLEEDKRAALLDAARDLFLKNSYANISIRKVAEKANVNSAMIAYYFGSKSGLFREMIKSYVESNINRAQQLSIDQVDEMRIQELLVLVYRSVPAELTHLIIRTLIYERTEMREWLLENLMRPALSTAQKIAKRIIDEHGMSVDPLVFSTLLQSMVIGPKLLQPILKELRPTEINDDFFDQLALLNAQLIATYFELDTK